MYATAEKNLADLLGRQPYPQLMNSTFTHRGGPAIPYQSLLVSGRPNAARCQQAAAIIVKDLRESGGVRESGTVQQVRAELWSKQLCRGMGAVGSGRVDSPWWFDAELVRRWERVYAAEPPAERRIKVMVALRPMLAVRKDWNDLLRLVTMTPGGLGIPVLTAQGTHQPLETAKAHENVVFIGGFQQVYVPFVPTQLVGNY